MPHSDTSALHEVNFNFFLKKSNHSDSALTNPIGNDEYEAGRCNKISTQWLIKIIISIYRRCRNVRHQWTLHILNVRCLSFANFVFSNINEKKDIFVLFHRNKLDKNNFRVSQRGASNLRSPNIKPELHCKYCNSQS